MNVEVDTTKSEPEPVANVVPESKGIEPTPPEVETKEDAPPKEAGEDEKVKGKEETKVSGRSKVRSILPSEMVDLAIESNGIASWEPMTIGQMFQESYQKFSDRNALCYKEDEGYKCVTYTQYYTICVNVAKSFIKVHNVYIILYGSSGMAKVALMCVVVCLAKEIITFHAICTHSEALGNT